METENTQATLFHKIASVMASVRTLEKTGRNPYDKYDFLTADAVATRIGSALAAAGVAFFPSIVNVETSEYTTQKGTAHFRSVVQMQITFACAETGATFTIPWFGEAIDRSDKSITKATTSAVKYALIKTFLLAGGDEDDADAHSPGVEAEAPAMPSNGKPAKPAAKPAAKTAQKPQAAQNGHEAQDNPWDDGDYSLTRLEALGLAVYAKEWPAKSKSLVEHVTTGNTDDVAELTEAERKLLIGGLEKKLAATEPA